MTKTRYPVYVISKGRHETCWTADFLAKDQTPFNVVVEPQEAEGYLGRYPEQVLVLPFQNLGQGSIPARNWVWDHAREAGAERHWILDDNMTGIKRRQKGRRIPCESGVALRCCEDFIDQYENVAVAGLNYEMFVIPGTPLPPFQVNCHVYSCLLINNELAFRWRGRYNEDTDLCLQALAAGWCTVLFNAFLIWKMRTMSMPGGNMEELYRGDGRLRMARSLERVWPGVVKTIRRYGRPQHYVDWKRFTTPLQKREGAVAASRRLSLRLLRESFRGQKLRKVLQDRSKTS